MIFPPVFLSELVRTVMIMSISGGVLALLLLVVKPLACDRMPKLAQYGLWLVVLFAFLIPFSRISLMPNTVAELVPVYTIVERNIISIHEETVRFLLLEDVFWQTYAAENNITSDNAIRTVIPDFVSPPELPLPGFAIISTILMIAYPVGVLSVLLYNIIGYAIFMGKLRRSFKSPPIGLDMLPIELANSKLSPSIHFSDLAATPMLIGQFRPAIILPSRAYTDEQLRSILLHELVHMRRLDIVVKWLSMIMCALHWFNPLAWLTRREIDRACELSCDEAVISKLDIDEKQQYGDTLISVASETKISLRVLSTTMCEEKRNLKERLTAIMKSRKHTRLAILASVLILAVAMLAACTLGAAGSIAAESGATESELAESDAQWNNLTGNESLEQNEIALQADENPDIGDSQSSFMDGITASEEQEQSNMYDLLHEVSSLTGQRQVDALFEMINNRTSTEITDKLTSYIAGMNRDAEQLLYRFAVSETLRVQQEIAMRVPTVVNAVYETGEFVWPVAGEHRVTSPFGARRHPIFGVMRTHLGIDIAGAQIDGDEVFAIGSGTVIISDFSTYYGNFIVIFHGEVDGQRITSLYAQLSTAYVSEGETVERGQAIGRVGSTGLSTGAHLHFEVLADEEHVNPSHFVRPRMN